MPGHGDAVRVGAVVVGVRVYCPVKVGLQKVEAAVVTKRSPLDVDGNLQSECVDEWMMDEWIGGSIDE